MFYFIKFPPVPFVVKRRAFYFYSGILRFAEKAHVDTATTGGN